MFKNHKTSMQEVLLGRGAGYLWRTHIKKNALLYFVGTLAVICTDIAEVALPKFIQKSIDFFSQNPSMSQWSNFQNLFLLLIGILFFQLVTRIVWRLTLGQQTHRTSSQLRTLLWDKARYLPRERLEKDFSPGELMNVGTADIGSARFIFGFTLVGSIDLIFVLLLTTLAMLSIDVELTLYALITLPLLPFVLNKLAQLEGRQHKESQEELSKLTDLVSQAVATSRLQKLTQTTRFWNERLVKQALSYGNKRLKVVNTGLSFIPITGLAPLISYAFLIFLGFKKVTSGTMSVGSFVAMQSYVFMIQGPLFELGSLISEWQKGFTSLGRFATVAGAAEATSLRSGGHQNLELATAQSEGVVFEAKNLGFKNILNNISFRLMKGQKMGIKGPVGAGKSTLIDILSAFQRDFTGQLFFLGKNILEYSHKDLRKYISIVPQKAFLFADTIRNNIRMDKVMSDEEIWHWLEVGCLKADVESFPEKLDTKLGEWGINLSGGQKQRLTLVRALASKPQVLLLDDCLSAVDTVTEEVILANLDTCLNNLTVVWVAHRDSTLKSCDFILNLESQNNVGAIP